MAYAVRCLSAQYISTSMLKRSKYSLNEISHEAAITLIRDAFAAGINIVEVETGPLPHPSLKFQIKVDTVGPKGSYRAKLEALFPGISIAVGVPSSFLIKLIQVEEKADSKFPIVSAASIAAKVTRDRRLRAWEFPEPGVKIPENGFGSGYPAGKHRYIPILVLFLDPNTKKFLTGAVDPVFGYPSLIRFSWKTADVILERRCVKVRWYESLFVEEERKI